MASLTNFKHFNDVMLSPNTIKHISLRLEVRTYHKSIPEEWELNKYYHLNRYVKIGNNYFKCIQEHRAAQGNHPQTGLNKATYWQSVTAQQAQVDNYTTAGINYGDWLVDYDFIIRQDDIDLSSSINYNTQQNVTRTLNLNIRNNVDPITLKGLQNWGADYSNNRQKWWLDKRLAVFVQVRLINKKDAPYWEVPMGVFIITGLSSTHTLTNYPVTSIQASSGEVLFSSRRGKFDKNITIDRGSSIIDGIKRILIAGGEKPDNILISPDVAGDTGIDLIEEWQINTFYSINKYIKHLDITTGIYRFFRCIDPHTSTNNDHPITGINSILYWAEMASGNINNNDYRTVIDVSDNNWITNFPNVSSSPSVQKTEDRTTYRTKYASTKFTFYGFNTLNPTDAIFPTSSANKYGLIATYIFKDENGIPSPMDFTKWNALSFYARSSMDLNDGTFQIWFYNKGTSIPYKINILELVGNVTQQRVSNINGSIQTQLEERENWRQMIIPLGFVRELYNVERMELVLNKVVGKNGYEEFDLWLDDILVSKINYVVPNPLNYTTSQNRWQAIKELSDLMLCNAYYTRDGYFLLTRQKLLAPTTYIDAIQEYLKYYFGPYNVSSSPSPPFNLIETPNIFSLEPFYNFLTWLNGSPESGRKQAANVLRISTNNLYSLHLVQPNTYSGYFDIYLYKMPSDRASKVRNHITQSALQGLFTQISSNTYRADLVTFLYWNSQNPDGQYNNRILDDLFDITNELIMNNSEFSAILTIEKAGNYQIPQDPPAVDFSDLQEDWRQKADYTRQKLDRRDGLYAGGTSTFEENEMANHIIALGGSETRYIVGKSEGVLTEDGFTLKVKGPYINERGRIRGINQLDTQNWWEGEEYDITWAPTWLGTQFYYQDTFVKELDLNTQTYEFFRCLQKHTATSDNNPVTGKDRLLYWKKASPGWLLNKDSDIDRLYAGCFNIDIVKEVLGHDKFLHLTQGPVANFTVEKIGDYIYHHNNGQPDSLLVYTWELMNRVIFEFKKRLAYSQKFSFQSKPYYGLDCYDIIRIYDRLLDIVGNEKESGERFRIETISVPLNGQYMSITASRDYRPNVGIPSFDQSHKFKWGPYFYGIDYLHDHRIKDNCNYPNVSSVFSSANIDFFKKTSWYYNQEPSSLIEEWEPNYDPLKVQYRKCPVLPYGMKTPGYTLYDVRRHAMLAGGGTTPETRVSNYNGSTPPARIIGGGDEWQLNILYTPGMIVRIARTRNLPASIYNNQVPRSLLYNDPRYYEFYTCTTYHKSATWNKPAHKDYWKFLDTGGLEWVCGQPISLTYDFYDLAFYQGEMSLEIGYAATPIADGDIAYEFLNSNDPNLIMSHRYKLVNGRWVEVNNATTGLQNEPAASITSSLASTSSTSISTISSMSSGILESEPVMPTELGSFLESLITQDSVNSFINLEDEEIELKGTIVVKHIWNLNGVDIEISEQEIYHNVDQHTALALVTNKWTRITDKDTYVIRISEPNEIFTFTFEYKPLPDWIITNNFHGKAINCLFININEKPLLSLENPVYIKDINNFMYIEKDRVYICGEPATYLTYVIHGIYDKIENSMTSIAIRDKDGNFGHFFTPNDLTFIKYYEQKYSYIEMEYVTKVFSLDFSKKKLNEIFISEIKE